MGYNVTQKIIANHLVEGEMIPGQEIAIRIDQTLTQDSTGTMAYLQFEAMGIPRVKTQRSVAYIDHNTLQTGFENADDHRFIQSMAKKHGIYLSRPGNGICHQVHLERFGVPGRTLLGSDSHTPTGGGLGMLAIGAGGLDVAVAMGGGAYYLPMPSVVRVELTGKLSPYVSAKDVILEVLRVLGVKGGVGRVIEYSGPGVATLSVPERATITNMGAELGATTSIFPSDAYTRAFLAAQGRVEDFAPSFADLDATYERTIEIDLAALRPLVACPHSPDNVKAIAEIGPIPVNQVAIGSCTNSSYQDMMKVAAMLRGKSIPESVSLVIAPGSKQVLAMLAENGALADMVDAGARILESACGPCIGMGQAPCTDAVSVRTFNRNFFGRSGTKSAQVYLVSPETAAATALAGVLTDPTTWEGDVSVALPDVFHINDNMIAPPASEEEVEQVEILRGPNIQPFPLGKSLGDRVQGEVLLKMEDNITTDHIMPSTAKLLPFRSNIPYLSEYCLNSVDATFPVRAKEKKGGILVAGNNYGQGSSREHAALVPLYLGIRAVIALSFARIHKANLLNSGILPLEFCNPADYESIQAGDMLRIDKAKDQVMTGKVVVQNITRGKKYETALVLSPRQQEILLAGGLLCHIRDAERCVSIR